MIVRELLTKLGFKVDDRPLDKLESGISNIKSTILMLGGVIAGAGASIGLLLTKAGNIEQVEMAFETMTGSAEKAKKLMEDITTFAAKTPFELTGLIESSKQLLAFGVESENIVNTMTNLGNISAGVGKDKLPTLVRAYGKIRVKGKASMEELNMLLEAGVPILDELSKNLNISTEELFKFISSGKVGFTDVDKAMTGLATGTGKFAGLMEKQSTSFLGIVSNIKDFITNLAIAIGKDLLPEAKALGNEIIDFLEANKEIIKSKLTMFFKALSKFVYKAFKAIKDFSSTIYNLMELMGGFENVIKAVGKAILALFAAKVLIGIGELTQGVFTLMKALKTLRMSMLLTQASALLIPLLIGAAIVALGLIIEDIIGFFQGKDSITGVIIEAFQNKFPKTFNTVKEVFTSIYNIAKKVFTFIYDAVTGIISITGNLIKSILSFRDLFKSFIGDSFSKLTDFLGFNDKPGIINAYENVKSLSGISPVNNPVPGISSQNQNNVKVDAPITITVPEGTPHDMVAERVSSDLSKELEKLFTSTHRALEPQVEY